MLTELMISCGKPRDQARSGEGGAHAWLHLLKLVGDHGEGFEDGVGGPGDGDDALGTVALRDVDASAAL